MQLKFVASIAIAILLFTSCKNSYNLEFKPKPGTKYEVQLTTNSITTQDVMGNKVDVKSLTEMVMNYDIEDGTNGGADKIIRMTFKSMRSSQSADGNEVVVDTNIPDTSNPSAVIMHEMMGAQFVIGINSKGEVIDVKGQDEFIKKVIEAASSKSNAMSSQMIAGARNFMSDDILKNMMEQSFKIFPGTKVKTGDSWKKSMIITRPLPMNIESNFTLDKVEGNVAKLNIASVVTPGKGGMEMMGTTIETELSGTQSGSMDIDTETGMTIVADIKQNIAGNMKAMDQVIPLSINSVITMKMKKL